VQEAPSDANGFYAYAKGIEGAAHSEDSGRPSYTMQGAEAAGGGPRMRGVLQAADVSFADDEVDDIKELLIMPFHRFSLLAPWARVAGYGAYGLSPKRAAALALRGPESAASWSKAVVFPPDGSSFDIGRMYEIEWPNPLSACPGYAIPVGLPLSVQTGRAIQAQAASVKDLTTGENLEVCTIDAFNYSNPDPAEQAHGRNLLQYNAAVVVIPKHPLTPGDRYAVEIHTLKHEFAWSCSIAPSAQENAPSAPRPVHKAVHHHPASPIASATPPMSGTSRVW